jgi:hypothetical protein
MSPAEIKLERRDSIFALRDVGIELKISLSRHPGVKTAWPTDQ